MDVLEVEKILLKKEEELDLHIRGERGAVRLCSRSIKEVHRGNIEGAKKLADEARDAIASLPDLKDRKRHLEQEYAEAAALICIAEGREIPSHGEMGVGPGAYLCGLLDCVGELRRLVFESLRMGHREKAAGYFGRMEKIYEEVGHLHFSSALVPELRRKQDAARAQVEEARGKLIK